MPITHIQTGEDSFRVTLKGTSLYMPVAEQVYALSYLSTKDSLALFVSPKLAERFQKFDASVFYNRSCLIDGDALFNQRGFLQESVFSYRKPLPIYIDESLAEGTLWLYFTSVSDQNLSLASLLKVRTIQTLVYLAPKHIPKCKEDLVLNIFEMLSKQERIKAYLMFSENDPQLPILQSLRGRVFL